MNVTPELISRYVDGAASEAEAAAVREALGLEDLIPGIESIPAPNADPELVECFEEMQLLQDLCGQGPAEPVSEALRDRLLDLKPVPALTSFERIPVPVAPPERSWSKPFLALAAGLLAAVAVFALWPAPEVVLSDFARLSLKGEDAGLAGLEQTRRVVRRAGDRIEVGPGEQVQFRVVDGSELVLLPGSVLRLQDPTEGALGELEQGSMLVTVYGGEQRTLNAGEFRLRASRAIFGLRMEPTVTAGGPVRSAGKLTVAVGFGVIHVRNEREPGDSPVGTSVAMGKRVVLQSGQAPEWAPLTEDALYGLLTRKVRPDAREPIPGYFAHDPGIREIRSGEWSAKEGRLSITLSDPAVDRFHELVLWGRTQGVGAPSPLVVSLVEPHAERPGVARVRSIRTVPVEGDWSVVRIALAELFGEKAQIDTRKIHASRGRLLRLEIRPARDGARLELKASLWAGHGPALQPEDLR